MKQLSSISENEHKTIGVLGSITSTLILLFYILFSVIKRFGQNDALFWIPLILFVLNLLVQLGMLYSVLFKDYSIRKNSFTWLIVRLILNLIAVILVGSYLNWPIL